MIADLPEDALLQRYREQGAYTDCFAIDVPEQVAHAAYVEAFYTTAVFKLERLLMCDVAGSTRSWLMTAPAGKGTRLYFGSAVVRSRQGGLFRALLGFHQLYSRILLRAAASRVLRAG